MTPLTRLEKNLVRVTAFAMAISYGFPGPVAFVAVFTLAEMGAALYLLMIKNGGGWPD